MEQVTRNADGLHWFKSSRSGSGGGDCVEVAAGPDAVYVRDSQDVERATLCFPARSWDAFVGDVGGGSALNA
ncbi:DUF397 domain-containing protein [Streptomyces chitinivorans]|uniref:DUF397 domain-containing protein n=1 Tax=Streptomyces chitinivorans TaxID=1257027 RepID=A0ABW7HRX1_9ACTN|nr:DUF397 domain-containing protein [Streptomyces chitinivorans]MDH2411446.1 DUF397 domain-containing protein [Streptomyces chitinivorans]